MVQITHAGENIEKITDILDAAQKRFGMYGLEKTTMSEIAADLNMSKGSIYYYFPDKEQLYKAVVEKEHTEFLDKVKDNISKITNPVEMLRVYVKVNLDFFRTLLNLSRTKLNEIAGLSPFMKEMVIDQRKKEKELLIHIFKSGYEKSVFKIENHEEVAILFLDLLRGLRRQIVGKKEGFYLDKEEYDLLAERVNLFTEIFINGMKHKLEN